MRDYRLEVATGRSRGGKSFVTAQRVKGERLLLVWDAMEEFALKFNCRRVSLNELRRIAARGTAGRFAVVCPVSPENFDTFCRCAWLWLRILATRSKSGTVVVEELADVTHPGKAPPAWGEIVRKSLRFGTHIYALTQRPAESDKTALGNATVLRCHSMVRANDRREMARDMDLQQSIIDGLDFDKKQYVEHDLTHRRVTTAGKGIRQRTLKN